MMRPRTGFWGSLREHWNRFLLHDLLPAGVVSGPANLMPREWQRAWQVAGAGDVERMDELSRIFRAFSASHRFESGKRSLAALKRGLRAPRRALERRRRARHRGVLAPTRRARFDAALEKLRGGRRRGPARALALRSRVRGGAVSEAAKSWDVAGTGSMVVDEIHLVTRILGADEKSLLRADEQGSVVRRLVGGVVLNHLGWARVLGLRTAIFGKQADDPNGRFLRAGMERLGIEHRIELGGSSSSFAQIYVDPSGARAIYMARGATGEYTPDEIESRHRSLIGDAAVVTSEISQVPLATVQRVLELARASGARTVVDLDVSARRRGARRSAASNELFAVLRLADVIKPSLQPRSTGSSRREPRARARARWRERTGAKLIALTLGPAGSLLLSDGEPITVPAAQVRVVDTTGAGDAFLGGLLAGMHAGLDLESAAKLGNACGGACCEQIGAFPDEPERARARALELYAALGGGPLLLRPPSHGASAAQHAAAEFLEIVPSELAAVAARTDRARSRAAAELILAAESAGAARARHRRGQARARGALRGVAALEHGHAGARSCTAPR